MFSFAGNLTGFLDLPQTVCLAVHVDLACSLYSWWEGFRSSSLATRPLGLSCGFTSTAACVSPQGFAPEAALEDLALSQGGPAMEGAQRLGLWGPWKGQGHRVPGSQHAQEIRPLGDFANLWQLCLSENQAWRWFSCSDLGDSVAPSVQGHQRPRMQQLQHSVQFSPVTQSCPTLCEPQHPRLPCPSPTARVYPNPCPLSQ